MQETNSQYKYTIPHPLYCWRVRDSNILCMNTSPGWPSRWYLIILCISFHLCTENEQLWRSIFRLFYRWKLSLNAVLHRQAVFQGEQHSSQIFFFSQKCSLENHIWCECKQHAKSCLCFSSIIQVKWNRLGCLAWAIRLYDCPNIWLRNIVVLWNKDSGALYCLFFYPGFWMD